MTSLKGDLRSIMGTPFGGVGHAVLIFSRVTRAAFNSDSVVLQLHDRIEMPEEANGKFQVDGLDPGPIRIELEGGTVHNHGWNIDLPDEGVWSLTDLVDAQVDWSPAVIGRAEAAAREARDHADRAEAGADRVGTAEQVGTWASEASSSASAAASARSGAVTARDAAQSARDAAEGHANRASTSESNAKTSETNSKQHETNAGDYAAVATTAATEAVDAMERATEVVGGDFATRKSVDDAVEKLLSVDTTLATWTADAVGGRNLVRGATQEPIVCKFPASSYYRDIGEDVPLEAGQTYTFSVIIDKLSDDTHPIQVHLGVGNGKTFYRDILDARNNDIPFGKRFSLTFTPTEYELEGENRTHFAWRIRNQQKETIVAYRELKVEREPVATPWTPAPEDSFQSLLEGNPLSSLLSPFPGADPALALWVDNSVGTRVFVGDVMIYGDTGWRSYPELFPTLDASESLHEIKMRRVNDRVEIVINAIASADGSVLSSYLPLGAPSYSFNPSIGTITIANVINYIGNHWSSTRLRSQKSATQGDRVSAVISYTTHSEWPTTLPGTPA